MTPGFNLGLGAAAVLLVTALLVRSCDLAPPIVIPDWADSLRAVRTAYQIENAAHRADVARERAVSDSVKREADSWRQRALVRPARPPRPGTIPPDSGTPIMVQNVQLLAQNDSLWAALDASDSAYASLDRAYTAQKQATAAALAGWAAADSAMGAERLITDRAIKDLTARLRKAQRGCRVLGLLPCPELALTGGATTLGGAVGVGATLGVSIPIKLGGS